MVARTAAEWFPILAKRHDANQPRVARLRGYAFMDGLTPPLPEGSKNTRDSWAAYQRRALLNLGGQIVDAAVDRMRISGVVVGEAKSEAETVTRRILRDARMEAVFSEAVMYACVDGHAFIQNAVDETGRAVITAENAAQVTVSVDPLRPWSPRAALKVWRDVDAEMDYAYVWDGVTRAAWVRPIRNKRRMVVTKVAGGDWVPFGEPVPVDGVPFVVIQPLPDGQGTFEAHTDVIDRVHTTILNRLIVTAMQAFRQRAAKGGLPETDGAGNPIDWAKVLAPAPGALWDLPEGVDLWESQPTDIMQLLAAAKDDLRDLAAVSRTPVSSLVPDGANQSAEGAAFAREGLISRVTGYLDRIRPALELVVVRALRSERPDLVEDGQEVTVMFSPPQYTSDTERMAALVQAAAAGVPWRTRMLTIGGYSAAEVDRMETERTMEALEAGLGVTDGGTVAD